MPRPSIIPKLNKTDIQNCYNGIGALLSDRIFTNAVEMSMTQTRAKLLKLGAKP